MMLYGIHMRALFAGNALDNFPWYELENKKKPIACIARYELFVDTS